MSGVLVYRRMLVPGTTQGFLMLPSLTLRFAQHPKAECSGEHLVSTHTEGLAVPGLQVLPLTVLAHLQ